MINSGKIQHVAIIMDGNRRWAKQHRRVEAKGHIAGYEKLKEVMEWCKEAGVATLTVYAFSTENWRRSKKEVAFLMTLCRRMIREFKDRAPQFAEDGVRVVFIGERDRFAKDIQAGMREIEATTSTHNKRTLVVALSYGARAEIVHAANALLAEAAAGRRDTLATEEDFADRLYTAGILDPDCIIRTGGDMRLSNFLLWQSAYAELVFTKTLWPAFTKKEFFSILKELANRDRRYGI